MPRPLADLDADLTAAYAARRQILTSGQSFATPAGLASTRAALSELNQLIAQLEAERLPLVEAGRSSVQMVPTVRGW